MFCLRKAALLPGRLGIRRASTAKPAFRVGLIPADGIGREVTPAAVALLESLQPHVRFEFVPLEAGWETFQKRGSALPDETVASLKTLDAAVFGAVSSPSTRVPGYSSPIVAMRKILDLYANLRPIVSAPAGIEGSRPGIDMLIVRENTECLYVKRERLEDNGETAIADRVITRKASTRIGQMAFEQAVKRAAARSLSDDPAVRAKRALVTVVHKSNVLSLTDGMFRESVLEVAKRFPSVAVEEQLVDSMVYKMILDPQRYDVVVAPNLYGDILSDAAAALVGGLGVAPSANTGPRFTMVEPVHGSAPDIAGKGIANPIATLRAAGLLLENLGGADPQLAKIAAAVEKAVFESLRSGPRTPDLGGTATTTQVTDDVITRLRQLLKRL